MSQPKKITEAELAEIRMLQGKYQEIITKLGLLAVERRDLNKTLANLSERETKANEEWDSLQKLEQGLLDKIIKVYGEGHLDMSDGTFTSDN